MPQQSQMPATPIISRIAPTPSGYLHRGNAYNFLLTFLLVRRHKGTLWLRIDDIDAARVRDEYIRDVFETLAWLGIKPDRGPAGVGDFYSFYSQQLKTDRYRQLVSALLSSGLAYVCTCSRRQIQAMQNEGLRSCACRYKGESASGRPFAIRAALDEEARAITVPVSEGESVTVDLHKSMGDFVLWRKDDMAAYQLASLSGDHEMEVNLIVRGNDLLSSTAAQLWLASRLGFDTFRQAAFIHHDLLRDTDSQKLSKSRGASSIKAMREGGMKVQALYAEFGAWLGLEGRIESLADLRENFDEWYEFQNFS